MRSLLSILNIKNQFQDFYLNYPFLSINTLIDTFSIFGGLKNYNNLNLHNNSLKDNLKECISNCNLELPFFATQDPFRKFLIQIAKGDGKIDSSLSKVSIGYSYGNQIVDELIEAGILYRVNSREKPLKTYYKQLIKKELRTYNIQNKLLFTKPIYKFWFAFVEPQKNRYGEIDINKVYINLQKYQNRLTSLVFEQLSCELLQEFLNIKFSNCSSYWDRFSEFDIYVQAQNGLNIVGECKYTSRPVTKAELIKLENKIEQSSLLVDNIAIFSKSGFSIELKKSKSNKLLLFELDDFKRLLNIF